MHHRILRAAVEVRAWTLRMLPAGAPNLAPPRRIGYCIFHQFLKAILRNVRPEDERPAKSLCFGSIVRCVNEGAEILVCHRKDIDGEGRKNDGPHRPLPISRKSV